MQISHEDHRVSSLLISMEDWREHAKTSVLFFIQYSLYYTLKYSFLFLYFNTNTPTPKLVVLQFSFPGTIIYWKNLYKTGVGKFSAS